MKIIGKLFAFMLLLSCSPFSQAAGLNECVNMNPERQDDVYRCISRIPGSAAMSTQGTIPVTCTQILQSIEQHGGQRLPSCQRVGDALAQLNGQRPGWYGCIGYNGSQQALNNCLQGVLAMHPKIHRGATELSCGHVVQQLQSVVTDANQTSRADVTAPPCDMVAPALSANGVRMAAAECLGYRPNDAGHMQRCLQPSLEQVRRQGNREVTCEQSRILHQNLLRIANNKLPDTYVVPDCGSIANVVGVIMNNPNTASTPAATAAGNTRQPAAQYPAAANPGNASYPAPTYSGAETREQQKAQKRAEKTAEQQEKIDSATGIMTSIGLLPPTTNTGAATPAASQGGATSQPHQDPNNPQQQPKQNDQLQQGVNAAKQLLDVFGN